MAYAVHNIDQFINFKINIELIIKLGHQIEPYDDDDDDDQVIYFSEWAIFFLVMSFVDFCTSLTFRFIFLFEFKGFIYTRITVNIPNMIFCSANFTRLQ